MAKSKGNTVGLIAILVALVMLVLAIVGVCISWVSVPTLVGDSEGVTLSQLFDLYGEVDGDVGGAFKAMASFAILTVILAAATTVLAGICKVLGWKLFRFVLIIVAIVCVICGVISIITSYTFCDASVLFSYSPAAGAWLTAIGGIIAGLVGVFAAVKS